MLFDIYNPVSHGTLVTNNTKAKVKVNNVKASFSNKDLEDIIDKAKGRFKTLKPKCNDGKNRETITTYALAYSIDGKQVAICVPDERIENGQYISEGNVLSINTIISDVNWKEVLF